MGEGGQQDKLLYLVGVEGRQAHGVGATAGEADDAKAVKLQVVDDGSGVLFCPGANQPVGDGVRRSQPRAVRGDNADTQLTGCLVKEKCLVAGAGGAVALGDSVCPNSCQAMTRPPFWLST